MANNIKVVLSAQGKTQKELAQLIGMSEVGLSKAINGIPSKKTMEKIANALGVTIDSLEEKPSKVAKFEGELNVGELNLEVAVLNDGTRIIRQADVFRAFDRPARGNSRVEGIPTFMDAKNLQPFIDDDARQIIKRVNYLNSKGQSVYGYDCKILPTVCELYLKVRELGLLAPAQIITAQKAEIIMRSFARVGIIALVDEATGYDKEKGRAKDELQAFFQKFLQEDAAKWVKTFPDSFFEDIYRMHGWTWNYTSKNPVIVGKYISDIVYERMGPIVPKLNKLNPKDAKGHRKNKHHQYLSREVGIPKLKEHLASLHTIAIMSNYNWKLFIANVDKVFPKKYSELLLGLDFVD